MPDFWVLLAILLAVAAIGISLWIGMEAKVGPFAEKA